MRHGGRGVHSLTDCILGTDSCLLQIVAVRDKRHKIYHDLDLGCLCGAAPTAYFHYLEKHTRLPIRLPMTQDRVDHLFAQLWEAITKTPRRERLRQAWISSKIWCLIKTRIVACRTGAQWTSIGLNHLIKASLQ